MIDEHALTDPSRCPACGSVVLSTVACPVCGVSLRSETALQVWQASVETAAALERRRALIERLKAEAQVPVATATAAAPVANGYFSGSTYDPPPGAPSLPPPRVPPVPPTVRTPEWSRRRVQNLLLGLGVLLLAVAAVIFLVVSWGVLGVGGRAAVMSVFTVVAAAGASVAARRGLSATAEAVATLTVGLGLLDAYGARSAGLADLDATAGLPYWAGALALIALAAGAWAVLLPLRSLRLSAAVLGQLPGWLLALHWSDEAVHPAAVIATVLTIQAVIALAIVLAWPAQTRAGDARWAVVVGAALAWTAAAFAALAAAYGEDGSLVLGTALLLMLAGAAVGTAIAIDSDRGTATALELPDALLGAAALAVVSAVWAPVAELVDPDWVAVTLSALAAALLAGMLLVPVSRRAVPVGIFLLAAVTPGFAAAEAVAIDLAGRLTWLGDAWGEDWASSARDVVGVDLDWPGHVSTPLLLLSVAVALLVAGRAASFLRAADALVVPVLAVAVLTVPAAFDLPFWGGLSIDVAVALLLLVGGPEHVRRGQSAFGWGVLGSGVVVLGVSVAWSFAAAETTLAMLPMAAAVLAVGTWRAGGMPGAAAVPTVFATSSVLLLIGEAAAVARYGGAGWPAVWTLALSLALGVALAGTVLFRGDRQLVLAGVATAALAADAAAVTIWAGGSAADAGLAVAVTGSLVVVATCQRLVAWPGHQRLTVVVGQVGVIATAVGVLGSVGAADRLWLALLAAGVAAGVAALRGIERHRLGWVSGGLLAASTWVRLALSDVDAPEPYTAPAGVALLVVGYLRRRRDPSYRSWPAYAPGLTLVLVPSLARAVDDPGVTRPLLLGLTALAVLIVGVMRRLQAPLVIGGTVLAVDALVQLSPYLADLYDAVPRWTWIGASGLLLLALGATYERRVREVRRLHERISAFG
ncbi:MAG: hypothetical protein ABJA93_02295 [Sporichthyaceae bacterium]